jgi:flagellar motor protein MotB
MPNDVLPSLTAVTARPRVRRALTWLAAVLVAFSAIGFLVLPLIAKPALEHALSNALARKVTIGQVKINPYAISATLGDVSVAERGEGPPLLTLGEIYVNGELASILRWAPVISALRVTRPALHLVRNADRSYNVSDLLDQALAGPPGPPPRFSVSNIEVVDGHIEFDDRPEHRQHQVTELKLGIPFVSSLPTQTEIEVEPVFSALVNGRPVAVTGETRPFKDTHETVLHWELSGVPLSAYVDYVPVTLPVKLPSGSLDAKIHLSFVGRGRDPSQLTIAGTARVADLALTDRAGRPLLRAVSLSVALDRLDAIGGSADVRSIAAEGMQLELARARTGELNLATLAASQTPPPASRGAPFRFHVRRFALSHGTVHIADEAVTPAFVATLNDVAVDVANLASTGEQKATVALSFTTDAGEHVTHRGTLGLTPLVADGRLEVAGLKLKRLFPYYASALNVAVDDGALDLATDVRFSAADAASGFTLSNLAATVSELNMRLPEDKELLWRVPMLAVHDGSVDVGKHAVSFDVVEGRGAAAVIRRAADGRLNFARLIRTPEGGVGAKSSEEAWRVAARKVALDDFSATFIDETVTPPAHVALSRVVLAGENLSNAAGAAGRVSLQATVNKRGTLSMTGPLTTAPFAATLNVTTKNVELVPFQPYITQAARVVLTGGSASAKGTLDFAMSSPLRAGFKGGLVLEDVAALDEVNATDLLKWKSLTLGGIDAKLEPLAVNVGDIVLDDFYARLILNETGEFNLQQLARGRTPATTPPAATEAPKTVEVATPPGTATTWLKLGKTTLTGGTVYFTDHFIRPNYSANLTGLAGSLSTLAFDQPADVELRGKVQDTAPVEIEGRINPLAQDLFLDLKASASDIELSPLSPYSGKYVGYGIQKGKLSMKVKYLIDHRKLTAENSIVLDQLTFGDKVESPDATKLPVLLAVALLKDRNGVINLDLPVGGSLDDPQFSVGGIVFRALVNLIVKVITAPFALLGSLAGHGEELAYIEFTPGSATLDPAGNGKVQSIAKALTDRPALKLDVAGRTDPATDRDGLKRAALEHKIRLQKFNDLVKRGEPPASVDAVEVSAAEYEALLGRVYKAEDFPKPRNAIGLPKDLPREEMEALILTNTKVSDEDLHLLAEHRAQTVRESLVDKAHVPAERVFLVAPKLDAEGIKDKGKATRVDFALR